MKYNTIFFLAALSLAALSTGCSSNIDDTTQVQSKETIKLTLTEQSTSVSPMSTFVVNDDVSATVPTRSSFTGTFPSTSTNGVTFKWETGDNISLYDGLSYTAPDVTKITPGQPTASFTFNSVPSDSSYTVYYIGQNGTNHNGVNIAAVQTQTTANDSKHIGTDGDCGVATVQVSGSGTYDFTLNHKSSYLCFLPYNTGSGEIGGQTKLTKVTVETTDNSKICGAYTLSTNGTLTGGTGTSITLNLSTPGFPIYNYLSQTSNAAYMVIAPGTHALKIVYDILLPSGATDKVAQTVTSTAFNANTVYSIQKNMISHVPQSRYHLWDAVYNVWDNSNATFPTSATVPGANYWYNTTTTTDASHVLDINDPTATQMYNYVVSGNAYWDASTNWWVDGRFGTGGIWLKKNLDYNYINQAAPNNTITKKQPIPGTMATVKPADLSTYFFLPAAGYYTTGGIPTNNPSGFTSNGYYHSKTVNNMPGGGGLKMYVLHFNSTTIELLTNSTYERNNAALLNWIAR